MAQHPYYYTINDDNGLPSNEVYDLQQDSFGYMWIGCDAGLFRYDGFKFRQFKNKKQNAVAISGLQSTTGNRLFCQNFFGQIFNALGDSLILFTDVKNLVRSHPEYAIDNSDKLWVGLPDGLLRYDTHGNCDTLFKNEVAASELEVGSEGDIYVFDAAQGLMHISYNSASGYVIAAIEDSNKRFKNSRCTFRKSGDRVFAIATSNNSHIRTIVELKRNDYSIIRELAPGELGEFIYTLALIENKMWLGTSNGAYSMPEGGGEEHHYLAGEKISDIFYDREGTYWFSSLQNGIFCIPHLNLSELNTTNSAIRDNNITALKSIRNNTTLLGTYTGEIYSHSFATNKTDRLPKSKDVVYRNVASIIPYNDNTIIACRGGLSVVKTNTHTEHSYPAIYIRDMAMVGDSIICVSTQGIHAISNVSRLVKNGRYHTHTIKEVSGRRVCYDPQSGSLWVTLNEGLARMEGNDFNLFKINGQPVYCNALYAGIDGLWVGTVSDGMYHIRNGQVVKHLNAATGLRGNNIKCITSAGGTLYVATNECVNIMQADGRLRYLDHADGINAKEINAISVNDSIICIATIRGLFSLPLATNLQNDTRPNIRIVSVYVDGKSQLPESHLKLGYDNKDIVINFSATAFRSRGSFHYEYRITGQQDEWKRQAGNINSVGLSHLPTGHFSFEVKAVNEDGIDSATVARIPISVSMPFWEHWLFYLLIAITASALVTLVFILRIRNIRRKADIREKITNSQLTALKAQMNPHFMYNTLNSIQDLVLQNDIKNSNYYLSRYSSLMRKILDISESNEIELSEEAEILQLYLELEQLRFGDDFSFSVSIAEDIDKTTVLMPSMIVQPFVENAMKHGLLHKRGKKHLAVSFTRPDSNLRCTITDNGVGRARAAEIKHRIGSSHKSFATSATEKRLALINLNRTNKIVLSITDLQDDGIPVGTEVRIDIPLS